MKLENFIILNNKNTKKTVVRELDLGNQGSLNDDFMIKTLKDQTLSLEDLETLTVQKLPIQTLKFGKHKKEDMILSCVAH